MRFATTLVVLQCWLHMPQVLPNFRPSAVLSAVLEANSFWGMCSKICNTAKNAHSAPLWLLPRGVPGALLRCTLGLQGPERLHLTRGVCGALPRRARSGE